LLYLLAKFTPQPVGVWLMNADWKGKDQSGFGNDATPNDVTLTTGPMGEKDTAYKYYGRASSYLSVKGSSSMDVGSNGSFTFTAFVRIQRKTAAFLEYNEGVHIWSYHSNYLYTNLVNRAPFFSRSTNFKTLALTLGSWHFIAVSYDKTSSKLTAVIYEKLEQREPGGFDLYTQTNPILLGTRFGITSGYLLGDMSCAMLFSIVGLVTVDHSFTYQSAFSGTISWKGPRLTWLNRMRLLNAFVQLV
jgi:hypothetical protein